MFSEKSTGEKAYFILINLVRISLIVSIVLGVFNLEWFIVFVSGMVFILTFLPGAFEKRYKINLPIEFAILTVLFIYASLFLGEAHSFYMRFFWWDIVLHFGSAVALGFVGFTILYVMNKSAKIELGPAVLCVFAFCFAMTLGALWEIFEFAMDQIFLLNMQKSGLVDTMWDLIANTAGALLTSLSGYLYLKGNEDFIFSKIMKEFKEKNRRFFRRKTINQT